ncbi:hypothetical protein U0070_002354 [Myodes glareolus]|uniref:Uncharacterized protein n=1 Tax=Myodes glareolus TaxID=447135 RepID=A0AAW0IXC5_MYOGA
MGQPCSSVGDWDGGELVEAKTRDPNSCETPFPSHSVLLQQQQEELPNRQKPEIPLAWRHFSEDLKTLEKEKKWDNPLQQASELPRANAKRKVPSSSSAFCTLQGTDSIEALLTASAWASSRNTQKQCWLGLLNELA